MACKSLCGHWLILPLSSPPPHDHAGLGYLALPATVPMGLHLVFNAAGARLALNSGRRPGFRPAGEYTLRGCAGEFRYSSKCLTELCRSRAFDGRLQVKLAKASVAERLSIYDQQLRVARKAFSTNVQDIWGGLQGYVRT